MFPQNAEFIVLSIGISMWLCAPANSAVCLAAAPEKWDYAANLGFTLERAFTTYYLNPLSFPLPASPSARTFDSAPSRRIPVVRGDVPPSCPRCALRFKFCHGTNCLTNRIFASEARAIGSIKALNVPPFQCCSLSWAHFVLHEAQLPRSI